MALDLSISHDLKPIFFHYPLIFKRPAGTSRGVLKTKDSWFIFIRDTSNEQKLGIGEVSTIPDLSIDPADKIEAELHWLCQNISKAGGDWIEERGGQQFPAIRFGLETALLDKQSQRNHIFNGSFFHTREKWYSYQWLGLDGRAGIYESSD